MLCYSSERVAIYYATLRQRMYVEPVLWHLVVVIAAKNHPFFFQLMVWLLFWTIVPRWSVRLHGKKWGEFAKMCACESVAPFSVVTCHILCVSLSGFTLPPYACKVYLCIRVARVCVWGTFASGNSKHNVRAYHENSMKTLHAYTGMAWHGKCQCKQQQRLT